MKLILVIAVLGAAAWGQTPAAPLVFEVATIKPAPPINPANAMNGKLHVGMKIDAARVDIGFFSLADIIPVAYRVKPYQVSGPSWMSQQRFDIQAKMPEGANKDQVPDMLQALLAERFKLVVHKETKEHSVYALVVGKGGPKLKESVAEEPAPEGEAQGAGAQVKINQDSKGFVVRGGEAGTTRMSMGPNGMHLEASKVTLAQFADMISRFVDRPVVDMTELKGTYQIGLDLSMEDLKNVARAAGVAVPGAGAGGDGSKGPAEAASDPSGSSIFQTVQQLGLKLEPRKAPIEQIVVDKLEKAPTEN